MSDPIDDIELWKRIVEDAEATGWPDAFTLNGEFRRRRPTGYQTRTAYERAVARGEAAPIRYKPPERDDVCWRCFDSPPVGGLANTYCYKEEGGKYGPNYAEVFGIIVVHAPGKYDPFDLHVRYYKDANA